MRNWWESTNLSRLVTLHVSVWVEMFYKGVHHIKLEVTLHVSVWVEICIACLYSSVSLVTLHVSVWVEIVGTFTACTAYPSRSTWACELKLYLPPSVSSTWWSRSTWACELKFALSWNYPRFRPSRSTWACELKCNPMIMLWPTPEVTLHVSVWVEMQ